MSESTETTADPVANPVYYTVKNFIDATQLKRDLAFTLPTLTDAMMQQASLFAHYGVLAAESSRQVDVVEMLLESTEAAVYKILRNEAATAGEKVTEAQLEKMIARNNRVVGLKKALNEAKHVQAVSKIAVEAFRHRKDMIVQQGAISREEMKGELSMSVRALHDDAMEAKKAAYLSRGQS